MALPLLPEHLPTRAIACLVAGEGVQEVVATREAQGMQAGEGMTGAAEMWPHTKAATILAEKALLLPQLARAVAAGLARGVGTPGRAAADTNPAHRRQGRMEERMEATRTTAVKAAHGPVAAVATAAMVAMETGTGTAPMPTRAGRYSKGKTHSCLPGPQARASHPGEEGTTTVPARGTATGTER